MRRKLLVGSVVGLVLAGIAEVPAAASVRPPSSAVVSHCGYTVTVDGLQLRTGPGTRYASVGQLVQGDPVDADRAQSGWFRVTLTDQSGSDYGTKASRGLRKGTSGWVAGRFLREEPCLHLD